MIRDEDYGLVSSWEELEILRRLDNDMRAHRCAEIGCRELIPLRWDYCDKHYQLRMQKYIKAKQISNETKAKTLRGQQELAQQTKAYDKGRRHELHDGFYQSKQWTRVSEFVKQRDGYCDAIDGKLWDKGDLIVDHIIPRRLLSKSEQLDTENLWLLTKSQHNHKTAVETKLNENVLKHAGRNWWINVLSSSEV